MGYDKIKAESFVDVYMRKKIINFLLIVSCLIGSIYFYAIKSPTHLYQKECAFCDTEVLESQKFYEDELVLALYTHKPIFPGHCLIIPKRHVERFEMLSNEEITQIGQVIRRVDQAAQQVFKTSSYLLLQKNGAEVGQTVPHVHFHYIPREAGDDSTLKFLMRMYVTNALRPIPALEMQDKVEKMKEAMLLNL
jgi:diadenosine tetraphosphate (Ap4A) HIT family hydrolase